MASTTFVDGVTPIVADWLNDVNDVVYNSIVRTRGTVVATTGQTIFTVPFHYQPGTNTLSVYINGVRQILNSSYTETSITQIVLSEAIPGTGALVEFVLE